jgi:hypothetical protein
MERREWEVTHGIDHEAYRNIATAHSVFKTLTDMHAIIVQKTEWYWWK